MIDYATIDQYMEYLDYPEKINQIAWPPHGNLKEYQRFWAYKQIANGLASTSRPGTTADQPAGAGVRILEIGAGTPSLLSTIQKDFGCDCWILDRYEGCGGGPTDLAKYREQYPGIHFVTGDIGDFSAELPDDYFDFVFSVSVIEHVPFDRWEQCFQDMLRVAKRGATLFHAIDLVLDEQDKTPRKAWPGFDPLARVSQLPGVEPEAPPATLNLADIQGAGDLFFMSPLSWHEARKRFPDAAFFKVFKRLTSVNIVVRKH
jgi:SAM-dependent methyltransferase